MDACLSGTVFLFFFFYSLRVYIVCAGHTPLLPSFAALPFELVRAPLVPAGGFLTASTLTKSRLLYAQLERREGVL